jgi:hypothetical protein
MPPKKKGGGKKKGKKRAPGPPIVTTIEILSERTKMLCPRMGDVYTRTLHVEEIMDEVVVKTIQKAAERGNLSCNLTAMRLSYVPNITKISEALASLTDLNLAKNNLFDSEAVFTAVASLQNLTKLNLSENYLNGVLPMQCGALFLLEELRLDVNQFTALCPAVSNWVNMKNLNLADNLLTSKWAFW